MCIYFATNVALYFIHQLEYTFFSAAEPYCMCSTRTIANIRRCRILWFCYTIFACTLSNEKKYNYDLSLLWFFIFVFFYSLENNGWRRDHYTQYYVCIRHGDTISCMTKVRYERREEKSCHHQNKKHNKSDE